MPPEAFIGWPLRGLLRRFVVVWLLVSVEFIAVFAGTDYVTAQHGLRLTLYAQAELSIPLVPVMVLPYCSVYLGVLLAPFVLRTRHEIDALAAATARVILIAGVAFLLVPAELGFAPVAQALADTRMAGERLWLELLLLADAVNLDYNLVPSLHVALFVTCLGAYLARASRFARVLLIAWIAVVAVSTVLTHQHHLIDVTAGAALGAWGAKRARRDHS